MFWHSSGSGSTLMRSPLIVAHPPRVTFPAASRNSPLETPTNSSFPMTVAFARTLRVPTKFPITSKGMVAWAGYSGSRAKGKSTQSAAASLSAVANSLVSGISVQKIRSATVATAASDRNAAW
jgi:hypothetical protein